MKSGLVLALLGFLISPVQAKPRDPLWEQGARVRAIAQTIPHPANWRFLVVDEVEWREIMRHSPSQ